MAQQVSSANVLCNNNIGISMFSFQMIVIVVGPKQNRNKNVRKKHK